MVIRCATVIDQITGIPSSGAFIAYSPYDVHGLDYPVVS